MGIRRCDIFWQQGHSWMNLCTCARLWSHVPCSLNVSSSFLRVRSTPWCPSVELCTWLILWYSNLGIWNGECFPFFVCERTDSACATGTVSSLYPSVFSLLGCKDTNLEKQSATSFFAPAICSMSKSYCCISNFQRMTFSDAWLLMYVRFLWSVRNVNFKSLINGLSFLIA